MTTVGDLLKTTRLEKRITLEQVEKVTKIRAKILANIENNNFSSFDSATITTGFIKNYASFLGIPTETIMAFYRRQSEDKIAPILTRMPKIPTGRFHLTPTIFTALSIALFTLIFLGFLFYQYYLFSSNPPLQISSPQDNSIVSSEEIKVVGKTDPDASVLINNQNIRLDASGTFSVTIPLTPGLNVITIKATNKFQRSTIVVRHLRQEST